MREVKFRAWDKEKKKMFEVTAIEFKGCYVGRFHNREETAGLEIGPGDNGEQETYESSPILMQYTGLKDKNGKQIYEGDVVKKWKGEIGQIKWVGSGLKVEPWTPGDINDSWEVIGNVHENPELLK